MNRFGNVHVRAEKYAVELDQIYHNVNRVLLDLITPPPPDHFDPIKKNDETMIPFYLKNTMLIRLFFIFYYQSTKKELMNIYKFPLERE